MAALEVVTAAMQAQGAGREGEGALLLAAGPALRVVVPAAGVALLWVLTAVGLEGGSQLYPPGQKIPQGLAPHPSFLHERVHRKAAQN